jgi:small-conductance mechanosensitive channel
MDLYTFLDYSIIKWLYLFIGAFLIYFTVSITLKYSIKKLDALANKTSTIVDDLFVDILKNIKTYFILFISFYTPILFMDIDVSYKLKIDKVLMIICAIQVAQLSGRLINFWIGKYLNTQRGEAGEKIASLRFMTIGLKIIVYSVIFLSMLNNLGIDVTALITGLGIGGVAVALALQNILTDLFSSLTIVLDKPFVVGDFIVVNDFMGTVEFIGIKTTRLRSISGEQLIFGNGDLLQSRIRNFKRMNERRIAQNLTVTYQTSAEMLNKIPTLVKCIIDPIESVRFDRCHFLRFKDSSLEFELVYWVESAEFNDYADKAHKINVAIFKEFNEHSIDFAYPTQTLNIINQKNDNVFE